MDYESDEKQVENNAFRQSIEPLCVTKINPENLKDYNIEDLLSYVEHEAKTSRSIGRLSMKLNEVNSSESRDFAKNINLESAPSDRKKPSNPASSKSFLLPDKVKLSSGGFLLESLEQNNENSDAGGLSSSDLGVLNNLEDEIQMLVQDLDKKSFDLDQSKRLGLNKKKARKEKREKTSSNQYKIQKSELVQKQEFNSKGLEETEQKLKPSKSGIKKKKEKTELCNNPKADVPLSSDLARKSQHLIDAPKNEILENFIEKSRILDKKVEETVHRYYGKDKNEIEKAKKALMDLKSGHIIDEENGRVNRLSQILDSRKDDMQVMKSSIKLESMSPMMIGGHTVRVNMLSSHLIGEFKVTKTTTFKELRQLVQAKTGIKNWCFQDLNTKRPLQNEDKRRVLSPNTHTVIAQVGLDLLIADSTLNGKQSMCLNKDGSCAFRVFWWDQKFHTSRLVWLKFEPNQISVTGVGGSFKLFDFKTMRVPLIFAGVRGSQLAFQFIKGKSNLASRFYAANLEQKKMIGIFFCFIWKPHAVKRGLIPFKSEINLDNIADEDDPRLFANVMRRHISEIEAIIRDIERTMDNRVVRRYIHLLSSIIGGAGSAEDSSFHVTLPTMNILKDKYRRWNENSKRDQKGDMQGATNKEDSIFEFFENRELMPFSLIVSESGEQGGEVTVTDGVGDLPPAPPLPPPGQMVQKPSICAINFDGISMIDIPGTIWAEIDILQFKPEEGKMLEEQLRIIFSRQSRERIFEDKKVVEDGVLEINRLKNVEVLLFMEELKHYTIDEIVDNILNFHESIFAPHVLERLVRLVNGTDGKVYSFLPSVKESEMLLNYEKRLEEDPTLAPLRLGEKLFLEITKRVPDRFERFEYGYFLAKFEEEHTTIRDQLDVIRETEKSIRSNEKFRLALRIFLEIINTLMPRFGLTKGFKISTFCSSVERVTGSASISKDDASREARKKDSERFVKIDQEIENMDEAARRKALKLERLRKSRVKRESDEVFWLVRLPEYMSIYLSKFEGCQGFWESLMEPCERAMKVDQVHLDQQSSHWIVQLDLIKRWNKKNTSDLNEPFTKRINDFIKNESALRELREEVLEVRKLTEDLWTWMGERMESEPQLIFKYIHDFCDNFHKQWNNIYAVWNENRTLALRGIIPLQACKKVSKQKRLSSLKVQKKVGSSQNLQIGIEASCEEKAMA